MFYNIISSIFGLWLITMKFTIGMWVVVFDFKHLIAFLIKPSLANNSFFSLTFHELYFKISKISLIKSLLNFKKFIFIQENDGQKFKKWSIRKVTNGQKFEKWSIRKVTNGQKIKKWSIRKVTNGQKFEKWSIRKVTNGQIFEKWSIRKVTNGRFFEKFVLIFLLIIKFF